MKPSGFIKITNGNYRRDNIDGSFDDICFRKENDKIVVTSVKGELSKLDRDTLMSELNKIFYCLYKKKVVLEEKSDLVLKKEELVSLREEAINMSCDNGFNHVLK